MPELVIQDLCIIAVGALGFIACGYGLTGRRRHGSAAVLAGPIALVLATILDLDRPRAGFIRASEDTLLRLKATLEQAPELIEGDWSARTCRIGFSG